MLRRLVIMRFGLRFIILLILAAAPAHALLPFEPAYADDDSDHESDHDSDSGHSSSGSSSSGGGSASDHDSRDRIRPRRSGGRLDDLSTAVTRGEAQPLGAIRAMVRRRYDMEIIDVEVKREDGHWIYEFKAVSDTGRVVEIYVDARTGAIMKIKDD